MRRRCRSRRGGDVPPADRAPSAAAKVPSPRFTGHRTRVLSDRPDEVRTPVARSRSPAASPATKPLRRPGDLAGRSTRPPRRLSSSTRPPAASTRARGPDRRRGRSPPPRPIAKRRPAGRAGARHVRPGSRRGCCAAGGRPMPRRDVEIEVAVGVVVERQDALSRRDLRLPPPSLPRTQSAPGSPCRALRSSCTSATSTTRDGGGWHRRPARYPSRAKAATSPFWLAKTRSRPLLPAACTAVRPLQPDNLGIAVLGKRTGIARGRARSVAASACRTTLRAACRRLPARTSWRACWKRDVGRRRFSTTRYLSDGRRVVSRFEGRSRLAEILLELRVA